MTLGNLAKNKDLIVPSPLPPSRSLYNFITGAVDLASQSGVNCTTTLILVKLA
jgi:hypothetical protein